MECPGRQDKSAAECREESIKSWREENKELKARAEKAETELRKIEEAIRSVTKQDIYSLIENIAIFSYINKKDFQDLMAMEMLCFVETLRNGYKRKTTAVINDFEGKIGAVSCEFKEK